MSVQHYEPHCPEQTLTGSQYETITDSNTGIVPLGLMEDGEPIGAYFIARRGGEGTLLRIMAAWERASDARPVPPL